LADLPPPLADVPFKPIDTEFSGTNVAQLQADDKPDAHEGMGEFGGWQYADVLPDRAVFDNASVSSKFGSFTELPKSSTMPPHFKFRFALEEALIDRLAQAQAAAASGAPHPVNVGDIGKDVILAVARGAFQTVGSVPAWIAKQFGGDDHPLHQFVQKTTEQLQDARSHGLRKAHEAKDAQYEKDMAWSRTHVADNWLVNFGAAVLSGAKVHIQHPQALIDNLIEASPVALLSFFSGIAGAHVAGAVGHVAAPIATKAMLNIPQTADRIYQSLVDEPPQNFEQVRGFSDRVAEVGFEQARHEYAQWCANTVGVLTSVASSTVGGVVPSAHIGEKLVANVAEAVVNQVGQNIGQGAVKPDADLFKGTGESVAAGLVGASDMPWVGEHLPQH
jgi:hypothetical protein